MAANLASKITMPKQFQIPNKKQVFIIKLELSTVLKNQLFLDFLLLFLAIF